MCSPFSSKELFVKKTFRSFEDVILTYSKWISPSRTSIGSTKCDHFYWGNKSHDELLFWGGMEILSSSTKRKALYTLLYLVHMIAVCSVVGLIAAVLLYIYCSTGTKMNKIAFGHCLIAYRCWCCMRGHRSRTIIGATWVRGRYSRQVQLVWESSDAGVIVKYLLGHTSLLLISWHSRAIFKMVTSTLSPQQLTLHWFWHIDGWKMHVLDNSTRSSMWSCREQ